MNNQIISKERVKKFGEVFTNPREVNAMLDLVSSEFNKIDSTFLDPACGTGNFLLEILDRKLKKVVEIIKTGYQDFLPCEYNRQLLMALSSIYGIDILPDNIEKAKNRLYEHVKNQYCNCLSHPKRKYLEAVKAILDKNSQVRDSLNGFDKIVFTKWSIVFDKVEREEYCFVEMPVKSDSKQSWSDEKLYKKYKLNQEEINFIESTIKPMN